MKLFVKIRKVKVGLLKVWVSRQGYDTLVSTWKINLNSCKTGKIYINKNDLVNSHLTFVYCKIRIYEGAREDSCSDRCTGVK